MRSPTPPPTVPPTKRPKALRSLLATLSLGVAAAYVGPAGCAAPFDPQSLVNSLRVISVEVDKPYALPGEEVTFTMNLFDGRDTGGEFTPVQVYWLAGCFNPPGNQYYGCYEPLGEIFSTLEAGSPPPAELFGIGTSFTLRVPEDIVSSLADPPTPPKAGTGFVFFVACAGELRPVPTEGDGDTAAGAFPLGCFDAQGNQLGADAFVPGFTQVFAFEDERRNEHPRVGGLLWNGEALEDGARVEVPTCRVTPEERRQSGCAAVDEFTECETFTLDVAVDEDVAEVEPDATSSEGEELREVVWVTYFGTDGDFETASGLVSDAVEGLLDDHASVWVPPSEPGLHTLWAVVRDNRGGSTTLSVLVDAVE